MKPFAIILSGSGVYDGSEIHEATLTLLAVSKAGFKYEIFAPNISQTHVIDHTTGELVEEQRNVLVESARIARGAISDLKDLDPTKYAGIILPGGFGAAKNLSSFAFDGADCTVNDELAEVLNTAHNAKVPIGAMCISPVILARIFGDKVNLTIGNDPGTAKAISEMGAVHEITDHAQVIIDKNSKIVTTPCYMLDASIIDIEAGTSNLVKALVDMQ